MINDSCDDLNNKINVIKALINRKSDSYFNSNFDEDGYFSTKKFIYLYIIFYDLKAVISTKILEVLFPH